MFFFFSKLQLHIDFHIFLLFLVFAHLHESADRSYVFARKQCSACRRVPISESEVKLVPHSRRLQSPEILYSRRIQHHRASFLYVLIAQAIVRYFSLENWPHTWSLPLRQQLCEVLQFVEDPVRYSKT